MIHDIERTEVLEHGLGHWRVPYIWGDLEHDSAHYRKVMACQLGSSMPIPTSVLMPAMLWHTWRGTLARHCSVGGGETVGAFGSHWPDHGFDEWFMNVAVYPHIAFSGVLTFVPWNDRRLRGCLKIRGIGFQPVSEGGHLACRSGVIASQSRLEARIPKQPGWMFSFFRQPLNHRIAVIIEYVTRANPKNEIF